MINWNGTESAVNQVSIFHSLVSFFLSFIHSFFLFVYGQVQDVNQFAWKNLPKLEAKKFNFANTYIVP